MKTADWYDEDYFERGRETGKSGTFNGYTWRPDLSFPLAGGIMDFCNLHRHARILDFGCAKGYLVRAFRWLHRNAYGCDWSEYAISQAPEDVREFLYICENPADVHYAPDGNGRWDLIIAKDVMEHQSEENLSKLLRLFNLRTEALLVIVPLGDGKRHLIPYLEEEISHDLCKPFDWWLAKMETHFPNVASAHTWPGIKPQWAKSHPQGNAIFHAW